MQQRFSRVERSLDALRSIRRDLAHAARSLAKDRAFTLVCVISLGIGMGGLVALATFTRADHGAGARHRHQRADRAPGAPARSAPRQSRRVGARTVVVSGLSGVAGRRYRHGHHGVDPGIQPIRRADSGRDGAPLVWRRCTCRPTTSARSACRSRADRDSIPRSTTQPSAEPRVVLSDDFWQSRMSSDPDIVGKSVTRRWRPAYGGRDRAGRLSRPLPFLPGAGFPAVHPPGTAPASEGEPESSRRSDRRLGAHPRPARTRASTSRGRTRWSRRRSPAWRSGIPRRTNSRRPRSSRIARWVRPVVPRAGE